MLLQILVEKFSGDVVKTRIMNGEQQLVTEIGEVVARIVLKREGNWDTEDLKSHLG